MKLNQTAAMIPSLALLAALALTGCPGPQPAPETSPRETPVPEIPAQETPAPENPVPEAPGAATLVPGECRLTLNWEPVEGATRYEVWYGTEEDPADAVQSGGDIAETTYELTGLARGVMYHVWLKAKNASGVSDFGPVASGNEGEWTLLWVSFNQKKIAYRRNYYSGTGGHLNTFSVWMGEVIKEDVAYSLVVGRLAAGEFVDDLVERFLDPDHFVIGNEVRLFNGNDHRKFSNAVTIGE